MRGIRVCDGYLVSRLGVDLPGNGARNPSCYLLSMRWFYLEEERVTQQSSVSITLSFDNQGTNPELFSVQNSRFFMMIIKSINIFQ